MLQRTRTLASDTEIARIDTATKDLYAALGGLNTTIGAIQRKKNANTRDPLSANDLAVIATAANPAPPTLRAAFLAAEKAAGGVWDRAAEVEGFLGELRQVNEALWEVEEKLRGCERRGEFGAGFVAMARSVYRLNDRRFELKRRIDEAAGSGAGEEKEYGAG